MKVKCFLTTCMLILSGTLHASELEQAKSNPLMRNRTGTEKLQWKIGIQLWTFGAYSLPDQLRLIKALDVDYLELGPNIQFSTDEKASVLNLSKAQQEKLRHLLEKTGIPVKQLYVHIPKTEARWREYFEFSKTWNIDTLIAEPLPENYPLLEKLCKEYGTRVGVHNHPNEKNPYWHPDKVIEQIANRDPMIGFNPDLGHWIRMGIDPLEQLKRPEVGQRVVGFHFNDVKELGVNKSPHVVPGTGAGRTGEMLKLLKQQGYKGRFSIEHGNWNRNFGEVADSIRFFDATAAELATSN